MHLLSWLRDLQRAFGTPFLLLVFTVYWTQGFRSFPWTGISLLMKDQLKLGPAAAQLMTSTAYIPWSVKPIYGIVSDCIPIRGQRRVPYILLANVLALVPWVLLAAVGAATTSPGIFTVLLVFQNVGAAMADVVVDAMVAESTKGDREAYAGDLQALSWFSMAVGGVLGSLLGGPSLEVLQPRGMFALFALCPLGQLALCMVTNERSLISDGLEDELGPARGPTDDLAVEELKYMDSLPVRSPEKRLESIKEPISTDQEALPLLEEDGEEKECEYESLPVTNKDSKKTGAKQTRFSGGCSTQEETPKIVAIDCFATKEKEVAQEHRQSPRDGKTRSAEVHAKVSLSLDVEDALEGNNGVEGSSKPHPSPQVPKDEMLKDSSSKEEKNPGLRHRASMPKAQDGEADGAAKDEKPRKGVGETGEKSKSEGKRRVRWQGWELWRKVLLVVRTLWEAVLNPDIHRPMLWFMASCALVPSLQTTMFYFHTNGLGLDMSFLGTARVVGWGGLMLGTLIYNSKLKYVPMRRIFRWVHLGMALLTMTDCMLTSRINLRMGIPDKVFVLGASAVSDAVSQFRFMPFLILSARLCPPGIEGTLFALFMSAYNFGNTLSGYMGATLATRLGITSTSFTNLTWAVVIQAICNLLPVFLLAFVPAHISGAGDEKHVVREVTVTKTSPEPSARDSAHTSAENLKSTQS